MQRKIAPPIWLLIPLIGFPQLSENIYSPALPAIKNFLSTSGACVQWTLSIYLIGFALGVFLWGKLSDHTGRKKAMVLGLLTYTIGSFFCLFAHHIAWLFVTRFIQGLGAACGSVLIQTIARESMEDAERHRFYMTVGFVMAFSITVGPFVGGYLTQWFHWQSNFILLFFIGIILILLTLMKLPETKRDSGKKSDSVFTVFKKMLKDNQLIACACLVAICNGILFSYYAEAPFLFIKLLGLSPSEFGKLGLFIALAALSGTLSGKKLSKHWGSEKMLFFGTAVMTACSLFLSLTTLLHVVNQSDLLISTVLIIASMMGIILCAYGFVVPHVLNRALIHYQSAIGTAGALFGLLYYTLISLITWGMGCLTNDTFLPMPIYFLILSAIAFAIVYTARTSKITA